MFFIEVEQRSRPSIHCRLLAKSSEEAIREILQKWVELEIKLQIIYITNAVRERVIKLAKIANIGKAKIITVSWLDGSKPSITYRVYNDSCEPCEVPAL